MEAETGVSLVVLPCFRPNLVSADAVAIASGATEVVRDHGRPWRDATEFEFADLTRCRTAPNPMQIGLLEIPGHLCSQWWHAVDGVVADRDRGGPKLQVFFEALTHFLRYKRVRLPSPSRFDVMVMAAGRALPHPEFAQQATSDFGHPDVTINLGEDRMFIVIVNAGIGSTQTLASALGDISSEREFVSRFSEYPLVRLRLDPGQGISIDPRAVLYCEVADEHAGFNLFLRVVPVRKSATHEDTHVLS